MIKENEEFDWEWINKRRDPKISLEDTIKSALASWRKWIKGGPQSIEKCRRKVSRLMTIDTKQQTPVPGSREAKTLKEIYDFYVKVGRHRFEALAAEVAKIILSNNSANYITGSITPSSSDNGVYFISRLDLGTGFSRVKVIILGQAKCEKIDIPTNGVDIARTVARLRRGWLGVYVTTGYFSEPVQREIIEDQYPILLINGMRLASEVLLAFHNNGFKNVQEYLEYIDSQYESRIQSRNAEEILFL